MTLKEKQLAALFLEEAAEEFSYNICNDVDPKVWEDWSLEERQKFVREFHEWNGDPENFDPNNLYLSDTSVMSFLSHKLKKDVQRDVLIELTGSNY